MLRVYLNDAADNHCSGHSYFLFKEHSPGWFLLFVLEIEDTKNISHFKASVSRDGAALLVCMSSFFFHVGIFLFPLLISLCALSCAQSVA